METVFQFVRKIHDKKLFASLDKEIFAFTVNWAYVLAFVCFWSYGVYGFLTPRNLSLTTHVLLGILLLAIYIFMSKLGRLMYYVDRFVLTIRDVFVLASYVLILAVSFFRELSMSIDGDQLYHSQQALAPSLKLVEYISNHSGGVLDNIPFVTIVWGINIVILLLGIICYRLIKKIKGVYVLLGGSVLFLILRATVLMLGGNGSAFPSFRLFPLWLSSTLFSPSDFGFRAATFLGLVILMFVMYRYAYRKMPYSISYLFGLFVGTIPVLLHVGTLVEMSLWASFCLLCVLFFVHDWSEGMKISYVRIVALVVLFSTMRVSGFTTLVPLVMMMLVDVFKNKMTRREILYTMSLVGVLLPVIVASVYIGTPATYHGVASLTPVIEANAHLLRRLQIVLQSGAFTTYIYNSIRFPLVLLLLLLPLFLVNNIKRFVLVVSLFVLYFVLFYSIAPDLWGNGRYQAEYIVPFIVYSMYLVSLYLSSKKYNVLGSCLLIGCIMINLYMYSHMSMFNKASLAQDVYFKAMKKRGDYFVWSQLSYDFDTALCEARQAGLAGHVYYSPGNGYGYFAEILSGYTVVQMRQEKAIVAGIGSGIGTTTAEDIISDKDIDMVLINGSSKNKETLNEHLSDALQKNGWLLWQTFTNREYGTTVYAIKRVH